MSDWIQDIEDWANGKPVLTTSYTEGDDMMVINAGTGEITYECDRIDPPSSDGI